jgi:hypothetical protein
VIIILVFEKNANFFAENCQKSPKIVIITSTPDGAQMMNVKKFTKSMYQWLHGPLSSSNNVRPIHSEKAPRQWNGL